MVKPSTPLSVWLFVEILREYPRTIHFYHERERFKAEIFVSGSMNGDSTAYEETIHAKDVYEIVSKVLKYIESMSYDYEIKIKYDG